MFIKISKAGNTMSNLFAVELLKQLEPNFSSVECLAKYLGFKVEKVESIRELFDKNTIFAFMRPNNLEGIFAYVTTQNSCKSVQDFLFACDTGNDGKRSDKCRS